MRYFFIVLTVFISGKEAFGQTAEDSVKAVINTMFTAMKNADGELLKSCFSDSVVFQTIARNKDGSIIIKTENPEQFINQVKMAKPGLLDERIHFETVKVDGPLAIAWTPYHFYLDNQFSHCGVNSFQLVRFSGIWKIQYIIDTRRRSGCPDME